ncbi:hypothetical protein [Streptomyces noursei]|nr:hypothetical protein [Streptomyces noursei]AIA01300.1 hypothetical protein DC74_778 [Streptomyces noursei]
MTVQEPEPVHGREVGDDGTDAAPPGDAAAAATGPVAASASAY